MIWNQHIYDNLTTCASLCDETATTLSQASEIDGWYRFIVLNLDCADLCRQVAVLYVRGSENTSVLARVCIDVCQKCADEANQFTNGRCQQVALLCAKTIDSCRRIISMEATVTVPAGTTKTPSSLFYGLDLREPLYN
jgi:hypothetical protein